MKPKNKCILYSLFFLNVLIWGSSWASVRFLLEEYHSEFGSSNPFFIAALRYLLAGILILPVALRHLKKITLKRQDIHSIFYYGLFLIALSNALVFWSQQHLPSSLCSIIFSLYPVMILVLSFFYVQEEKTHFLKVLGTLISFVGVSVLFFDPIILEQNISSIAFFTMVFAVFFAAFPSVLIRKNSIHLSVFILNSFGMLFGGIILLILAVFIEYPLNLPASVSFWMVLAYLSVFASCYTLIAFFWLMRHIQITKLSLSAYLTPIVSLIIGVTYYHESLNIQSYTGMFLIFLGIFLIDYFKYKRIINVKRDVFIPR
jgi:drug/metabolite transporter (DMT)-like permease